MWASPRYPTESRSPRPSATERSSAGFWRARRTTPTSPSRWKLWDGAKAASSPTSSPRASCPPAFAEAVERGVKNAMQSGTLMGYATIDIGVTLTDAVYDELSSTELAFETAGALGFDNACREASPVLLEPVMNVDIMCPAEYVGDVISQLTQRGGMVNSMESRPAFEVVKAQAPMVKNVRIHHSPPVSDPGKRNLLHGIFKFFSKI